MLPAKSSLLSSGHVLVETMISLALASSIMAGYYSVSTTHRVQQSRAEQYYTLQQQAKNILIAMQRELAMAGFRSNIDGDNPFMYNTDQIYMLNSERDCIVYRYDRNNDGALSGESFGFRLHKGGLQQRKGSDVSCDGGIGWEMISDTTTTEIMLLQFISSQQRYIEPDRVTGYVTIILSIRHRKLADMSLQFFRNSYASVLL